MECQQMNNLKSCSCTSESCERKGICCECVAHHRAKGQLPSCLKNMEAK